MARMRLIGSWVGIAAAVVYWERQGILRGRGTAAHKYRPCFFISDWRWADRRALCEANALARDGRWNNNMDPMELPYD